MRYRVAGNYVFISRFNNKKPLHEKQQCETDSITNLLLVLSFSTDFRTKIIVVLTFLLSYIFLVRWLRCFLQSGLIFVYAFLSLYCLLRSGLIY